MVVTVCFTYGHDIQTCSGQTLHTVRKFHVAIYLGFFVNVANTKKKTKKEINESLPGTTDPETRGKGRRGRRVEFGEAREPLQLG